ncbi:terminase small subunit [Metabacillus fastidiosus]|uniref:terminase small subunit n=1 Tax=Metabacillus fastidiosus TaxID=1458 RepID=UPI003D2B1338
MNWKEIRKEWESTKITLAALSEKYNVKIGTLKSRKSREGWSRDPTKKDATKSEKVATIKKKDETVKTELKQVKEAVAESGELTDKQWLFCMYYVKYFNATKAYQKAYECDYISAKSNGYRLLTNDYIKLEIQRMKKEVAEGIMLDASAVLQKYIDIAFADITDFVEFGREEVTDVDDAGNEITYEVNRVKFKQSGDVDGTIITEIKQGKDGVSIKLADKMKSLDFLSKYTDLLSENDQKKLQKEKIKIEIAKLKTEVENIKGDNKKNSTEDWIEALNEVAEKRKVKNNE